MAINVAVFALQFLTKDKLLLWGAKVSFQLMWQSLCARPSLGCQVSGHGQVFHKPGSCMSYANAPHGKLACTGERHVSLCHGFISNLCMAGQL